MDERRLIRIGDVKKMTGRGRSSIYADPEFPERVKIGSRSVAWLESEVRDWIDKRVAISRAA